MVDGILFAQMFPIGTVPNHGLHAGILCLDDERRARERGAHHAQVAWTVAENEKVSAVLPSLGLMPLIVPVAALEVLR